MTLEEGIICAKKSQYPKEVEALSLYEFTGIFSIHKIVLLMGSNENFQKLREDNFHLMRLKNDRCLADYHERVGDDPAVVYRYELHDEVLLPVVMCSAAILKAPTPPPAHH